MCTIEIKSVNDFNLDEITKNHDEYFKSPVDWADLVMYFLLVDRFSDGKEINYRDLNNEEVTKSIIETDKPHEPYQKIPNVITGSEQLEWRKSGITWQGGNLKGLKSKLGYLSRLGINAIWISPIFKQSDFPGIEDHLGKNYHGYAIQNYLDIDPHFGTKTDLKELVEEAHQLGIYVVLDIILNHSGNVFQYKYNPHNFSNDPPKEVEGFYDEKKVANLPFGPGPIDLTKFPQAWPTGAIWPQELQPESTFTRKGSKVNWEIDNELLEADFEGELKDINLGTDYKSNYEASEALKILCKCFNYWIAYADIDGFRIDTVKHMPQGAIRFFASNIHEFAISIGKNNFYLIAEDSSGREQAFQTLKIAGLNAILGITEEKSMGEVIKGKDDPLNFFKLFSDSADVNMASNANFRNTTVTMIDDHDQLNQNKEYKYRFCANNDGDKLILTALAFNLTTLGIPCIYYGSEQSFNGQGGVKEDDIINGFPIKGHADRYIREAMFGGDFGAFCTQNYHFFDETNPVYIELQKIIEIRKNSKILRQGRQYLRKISGNGIDFDYPHHIGNDRIKSIIAWSRIIANKEIICAINTDTNKHTSTHILLSPDNGAVHSNKVVKCLYSTDITQINQTITINNNNTIQISVPPGGFIMYH